MYAFETEFEVWKEHKMKIGKRCMGYSKSIYQICLEIGINVRTIFSKLHFATTLSEKILIFFKNGLNINASHPFKNSLLTIWAIKKKYYELLIF
jgi:hypothetical protein